MDKKTLFRRAFSLKGRVIFSATFLLIVVSVLAVLDRRLRANAANRASMFISIDWLIKREMDSGEAPRSLAGIADRTFSGSYEAMFPGGLVYTPSNGDRYRLEQRQSSFVSLFRRDRLVSSDVESPRYESGRHVSKY